jgi:hypothetical protein
VRAFPICFNQCNLYYVSFIDVHNFSRFTWVFLIQSKYDVMVVFLKFQTMLEHMLNSKLNIFKLTGEGNTINSTLSFNPLALYTRFPVHTLINNKGV